MQKASLLAQLLCNLLVIWTIFWNLSQLQFFSYLKISILKTINIFILYSICFAIITCCCTCFVFSYFQSIVVFIVKIRKKIGWNNKKFPCNSIIFFSYLQLHSKVAIRLYFYQRSLNIIKECTSFLSKNQYILTCFMSNKVTLLFIILL